VDRERKLLYAVAVIAPIVQVMAMIDCHEANKQLHRVDAANRDAIACEEHLLRAWMQCPGIRQRHPDRVLGTAPGDG
jgi:hypothetical protein